MIWQDWVMIGLLFLVFVFGVINWVRGFWRGYDNGYTDGLLARRRRNVTRPRIEDLATDHTRHIR